jgi:hypothetical protein
MGCSLRVTDRAAADAHGLKVPMKPQCMPETDLNIFAAPAFEPHSAGVNSPHGADADRFWPSAWRRWWKLPTWAWDTYLAPFAKHCRYRRTLTLRRVQRTAPFASRTSIARVRAEFRSWIRRRSIRNPRPNGTLNKGIAMPRL